ncbi:MAG: Tc toxin subunit A, partial [Pseudomonas sp.]
MSKRRSSKKGTALESILETEPGIKIKLDATALAQDSILSLQRKTTEALMAHYPSLHVNEAQRLRARLDVASAAMMRAFREKRLSASARRAADEMKGPLALSDGPTFENQFLPSWGNNAHPQAVDATTSPAAYLIDMLSFVAEHIESQGDPDKTLALKTRRPDVFDLSLDETSMTREVTQVEVVNHVLERVIEDQRRQSPNGLTAIEDKLLQVRYPFKQFPYEAYWEQISTVLAHNTLFFSDVSRLSDLDNPYFTQPGAHSQWSDAALSQDSSMGPALRAILTEAPYFGDGSAVRFDPQTRRVLAQPEKSAKKRAERLAGDSTTFFQENFGTQYPTLQNVVNFCQALQMTQDDMESLFGLAAYSPIRSGNVVEAGRASPDLFGARFINSGSVPPVAVGSDGSDPQSHEFRALTQARCDRVNRLVRLVHALKLPYAQADQLVCAIIDAEKHAVASVKRVAVDDTPLWMTFNTLRGLGLFQFLRERFSCSAEDFSTLLSDMAIFGVGDTLSHFDRVFNRDTTTPLVLDGEPFSLAGEDADSKRTIDQLCRGLGINMETFRYLSRMVMQGQGTEMLHRSLSTVSAFYRVTLLARLLSITTIELLSLLEVVSPEGLYTLQLAGVPQNAMYQSYSQADAISVIHAISSCVLWCQEQELSIGWLVQQLLPVETADVVPEEISALFVELKNHLLPFQDFDRLLTEAGVTPLKSQRWQTSLKQIVDDQGLITDTGNSEEDFDPLQYENFAAREIQVVIEQLTTTQENPDNELPALTEDEAERLKTLILGVVLRIRSQQWGVVQERLSQLLSLNADMVTVAALIQFGEQLRGYLEQEVRTELEALQFQQAAELASYTIGIQEQLYQQQKKNDEILLAQRAAIELRQSHYQGLYDDNISGVETAAMTLHGAGRTATSAGSAAMAVAYLARTFPNTFGLANGGQDYGGPMASVAFFADMAGTAMLTASELMRETEGYRRRRQEWQLQAKLAGKELAVIDKQLQMQQHATLAASNALEHSRKALAQTQQLYAFYQNKSTSVSLYRWLRSQATTWHATLFDVAVSLCNSAEACWQYETGNFDKRIIRTPVWQADRYGLNAGGELRLDLHRLESEALLRHERHLEVSKWVSLRALIDDGLVFAAGEVITDWAALLVAVKADGQLAFSLSETLYNKDYPGHYLRRLHSVALSLPVVLGPYQNIRATLTQTQSQLLIKPDIEGVKFLSPDLRGEGDEGEGRNVMMSLRARQQICLSSAIQDSGLFTAAEADDRYLPFEGTGAVSDWHLKFPRHAEQSDLLDNLSDIILEVRY